MRNRDKKASDFGLTKDKIRQIYKRCKHLDPAGQDLLRAIAREECPPGIAEYVAVSLITGKSYDVLSGENYIPIGLGDFYGYRRKTAAAFYKRVLCGKKKKKT